MNPATGLCRKAAPPFNALRRKSPSVKIPVSTPFAPVSATAPLLALVIAKIASCTVVFFSGSTGHASSLRMMSFTRSKSVRPSVPAGWNLAKSSRVTPRLSSNTIARASPRASAAVVLAVGARARGHASRGAR